MRNMGRRIRGAIGSGLTWAAGCFLAGILVARVPGFFSDLPFAIQFAPFGFVTGLVFFGILVVIEGRGPLDRMSRWRVAGWGAVSGLLVAGVLAVLRGEDWRREILVFGPLLTVAGALCAALSLAVAKR